MQHADIVNYSHGSDFFSWKVQYFIACTQLRLFTVATTLSTLLHIAQGIHSEENHMISTKGKDGAWFLIQKKDHSSKCNDM